MRYAEKTMRAIMAKHRLALLFIVLLFQGCQTASTTHDFGAIQRPMHGQGNLTSAVERAKMQRQLPQLPQKQPPQVTSGDELEAESKRYAKQVTESLANDSKEKQKKAQSADTQAKTNDIKWRDNAEKPASKVQLAESDRNESPNNSEYAVFNPKVVQQDWHQPLDDAMREQWRKMSKSEKEAAEKMLAAVFSLRPIAGKPLTRDEETLLHLMAGVRKSLTQGKGFSPETIHSMLEENIGKKPFRIREAKLCTRVQSYGVFDPFPTTSFVSGRNQSMIIYAELDDFSVVETVEKMKEVKLEQSVALYNVSDGTKVWEQQAVEINDKSRNQRRDFFVVQKITLPYNLSVGRYNMKITIQDKHGKQFDEVSLPVTMVAQTHLTHTQNHQLPGATPVNPIVDPQKTIQNQQARLEDLQSRVRKLPLGYSAVSLSE